MFDAIKQYPRAVLYALIVHLVIVGILVVSFKWVDKPTLPSIDKGEEIVKAVAVDAKKVEKELNSIKAAEARRQRELEQQVKRAEAKRQQEEQLAAEAKRKREAEKQAAIQEQEKLKVLEKERKEEEKRLADTKRKREVEKQAAEQQRQQEQERLKAIEEKRKQEEAELAEIEQKKRDEEMRRKLAAEEKQRAKETSQRQQSEIDKYRILIEAKVRQNWNVPPSAKEGMSCELLVRLIPSGDVISVQLTKSSGDSVFDRSVENAIHKASPLPVPAAETGLFDVFRDLRFPFTLEKKS